MHICIHISVNAPYTHGENIGSGLTLIISEKLFMQFEKCIFTFQNLLFKNLKNYLYQNTCIIMDRYIK